MQNNKRERKKMSKIRMNTELRNKLFNKIKHTFENEDTHRIMPDLAQNEEQLKEMINKILL